MKSTTEKDLCINDIKKGDNIRLVEYSASVEVKIRTEKAIMVTITNNSYIHKSSSDLWIPISLMDAWATSTDPTISNSGQPTFYVKDLPEWFVRKNSHAFGLK